MVARGLARLLCAGIVFTVIAVGIADARPKSNLMQVSMAYRKAIMKVKSNPVEAIPVHLDYAVKATEAAKADNNASYMGFTGGADNVQYLTEARRALDDLTSEHGESDADVVRLTALYDETWNRVSAMCSAFNESKLESERAPEDVYKAADRQQLEAMILEAWTKLYPEDEILDMRFHMAEWDRDKGRKWHDIDNAWYEFDKSVLAVSMIIKTSNSLATIFPAYANKDNLAGGKITIGVETKGDGYVHREVLIKNLEAAD